MTGISNYNPFVLKYVFWYKSSKWRDYIYDTLIDILDENTIERTVKNRHEFSILLKGGTFIRFIPALECIRGIRTDVSFVEEDFVYNTKGSLKFIEEVIRVVTQNPKSVYVVDEIEDVLHKPWRRIFY